MFILSQIGFNEQGDMQLTGINEAGETTVIGVAQPVLRSLTDAINDSSRLLSEKTGKVVATPVADFGLSYILVGEQPKLCLDLMGEDKKRWQFSLPLGLCGALEQSLHSCLADDSFESHLGPKQ